MKHLPVRPSACARRLSACLLTAVLVTVTAVAAAALFGACGLLDDPSTGLGSGRGDDPALRVTVVGSQTVLEPTDAVERTNPASGLGAGGAIRMKPGDVYDVDRVLEHDVRGATIALRVRVVAIEETDAEYGDAFPVLIAMLYDPLSASRFFAVLRPWRVEPLDEFSFERLEAVYGTADYPSSIALWVGDYEDGDVGLQEWKWIAVTIDRNGVGSASVERLGIESKALPYLDETRRSFGNLVVFPYANVENVDYWEWNYEATEFDPITNPPQLPAGAQFAYEISEIRVFAYALTHRQLEALSE
ncbi:MAG: hypothetical protein EA426_15510 [Spirochaetaceae bacterium]|nr:MAG: hypothetical protein EA426_15510 [Spirochaetaceae bacterium]